MVGMGSEARFRIRNEAGWVNPCFIPSDNELHPEPGKFLSKGLEAVGLLETKVPNTPKKGSFPKNSCDYGQGWEKVRMLAQIRFVGTGGNPPWYSFDPTA